MLFNSAKVAKGYQNIVNDLSGHVDLRFNLVNRALPIDQRKDHTQEQPLFGGKLDERSGI